MYSRIGKDLRNFFWDFYDSPEAADLTLEEMLLDFAHGFSEVFNNIEDVTTDDTVWRLTEKGKRYLDYLDLRKEFEKY